MKLELKIDISRRTILFITLFLSAILIASATQFSSNQLLINQTTGLLFGNTSINQTTIVSDFLHGNGSNITSVNADTVDGYHLNQNVSTGASPTFTSVNSSYYNTSDGRELQNGCLNSGYSYCVGYNITDGTTIEAVNGTTGAVKYRSANYSLTMQNVYNDMPVLGGVIVQRAGNYTATAVIYPEHNTILRGEGQNSTIINDGIQVSGRPIFNVTGKDNVWFEEIQLNDEAGTVDKNNGAIRFERSEGGRWNNGGGVRNVKIVDNPTDGTNWHFGIVIHYSSGVNVLNNNITNVDRGVELERALHSKILDNYIDTLDYGLVPGTATTYDITICRNTIIADGTLIRFESGQEYNVCDNYFEGGTYGMYFVAPTGSSTGANNVTIDNNIFNNSRRIADINYGASDISITNNKIYRRDATSTYGITVADGDGNGRSRSIKAQGNTWYNAEKYELFSINNYTGFDFSNNNIYLSENYSKNTVQFVIKVNNSRDGKMHDNTVYGYLGDGNNRSFIYFDYTNFNMSVKDNKAALDSDGNTAATKARFLRVAEGTGAVYNLTMDGNVMNALGANTTQSQLFNLVDSEIYNNNVGGVTTLNLTNTYLWQNKHSSPYHFGNNANCTTITPFGEFDTCGNTTSNKLQFYNGTAWETVTSS